VILAAPLIPVISASVLLAWCLIVALVAGFILRTLHLVLLRGLRLLLPLLLRLMLLPLLIRWRLPILGLGSLFR